MPLAFNACANCLHFEGDTETVRRFLKGRLREDAGAVHEECFESRAEPERMDKGFNKPVDRTDGLIQGELF